MTYIKPASADGVDPRRLFLRVLRGVCERPEMTVGRRDFKAIAFWLAGFSACLSMSKSADEEVGLDGFRDWLAARCYASHGTARNLGWFCYIESLYPTDDEALKHLPIIYDEFIQERAAKPADTGA